jgi:uncharacterized protein YbjQ (UPF0145 family)|nr:MAG TPA: hypothetical protein [Caudoviricetes sp.]
MSKKTPKYKAKTIDTSGYNNELTAAQNALTAIGDFYYNDAAGYKERSENAFNDWNDLYSGQGKANFDASQQKLQTTVDDLFDQIMNYGDFSYDQEKDQLFQIYKQQYLSAGAGAMKNQLAAASANTGGYNNSYAQQSAQQAYNNTMNGLSDKAIELRANALTTWQNEYNQIQDRYNLVNNQKAAEESSYYNKLNAANNAYNVFNTAYKDDYNNQYGLWSDNRNAAQTRVNNAQSQVNWANDYNANEINKTNTLNQQATQADQQLSETRRHNNKMETIAKKKSRGK